MGLRPPQNKKIWWSTMSGGSESPTRVILTPEFWLLNSSSIVNWCELTITPSDGTLIYKNNFVTNHQITDINVEAIVSAGRTRWKVENENNNTLKTKGYNLEHNFGHGKNHCNRPRGDRKLQESQTH